MRIVFADKNLEKLYCSGSSWKYPTGIIKKYILRITQIRSASTVNDLYNLNGLYIHKLTGSYEGELGIDLNDARRLHIKVIENNSETTIYIKNISNHYQ